MGTSYGSHEDWKRISLTLPASLHDKLNAATREENISMVAAIRRAITAWLERKVQADMAEGYAEVAEEGRAMMKDFQDLDREVW